MQKEIWKDIPMYEGIYKASSKGNIKSVDRIVNNRFYNGVVLSQKTNKYGYKSVCLCNGYTQKTRLVHQLIASTFLDYKGYTVLTVIDHVDNDKSNNDVSNLQIITHRDNNIKERKRLSLSKYNGVSFEYKRNKWRADIRINNKRKFIGYFKEEYDAVKAINDFKILD